MIDTMIDIMTQKSQRYKNVFSTAEGKEVLKDLMKFCHYQSPTYVIGDPVGTAHAEGMRRVILRIVSFLDMDEATIRKINKEVE